MKQERTPIDDLVNGITNLKFLEGFSLNERSTNLIASSAPTTPIANNEGTKDKNKTDCNT